MDYWIAIGPVKNWQHSMRKGLLWGVTARYRSTWKWVEEGDIVLFYAMAPVKGLVGYGIVAGKKETEAQFWPDEIAEKRSIWPLQLAMRDAVVLPETRWQSDQIRILPGTKGFAFQRALQRVQHEVAERMVDLLRSRVDKG